MRLRPRGLVGSGSSGSAAGKPDGSNDFSSQRWKRCATPKRAANSDHFANGDSMTLNSLEFRRAMGCFATGVTIITVDLEGEVHGMTANAFASVSLDPMLVLVCVDHSTRTHAHLHAKKRFGINILRKDQRAISEYYARTERDHEHAETEAGARFERTRHGTPALHGALAYLECKLRSAEVAGDHSIFIAEVDDVVVREGDPLLFFRGKYRKLGEEVEK